MSANCFGRGPTSCTSPLPQHSYRIAAESLSNGRQGLLTINKRFKWDCEKEILCLSTSGVELSITNVFLPCLPPTLAAVNLSMASTNFGDMCRNCAPILRGCQKRRHVPIVVKPWTCNHEFPVLWRSAILWCFKTSGTRKVPRNWMSSCACPGSEFNALTVCTPKAPDSAKNSSLRR